MRRILLLATMALVMAAMMAVSAGPVAAQEGAFRFSQCFDGTVPVTGVEGTFCEGLVVTPTGTTSNDHQVFRPDEPQQGTVLEGGAVTSPVREPSFQAS
jgi:hypothetical protein